MMTAAVAFLQNSTVAAAPLAKRLQFLQDKGLNSAALTRALPETSPERKAIAAARAQSLSADLIVALLRGTSATQQMASAPVTAEHKADAAESLSERLYLRAAQSGSPAADHRHGRY
jgi:hypothetical protein